MTPAALRAKRYAVTDVLSDLRGAQPGGETAVVASQLWQQAADLLLRAHGRWTGAGKALLREVRGYDASAGTAYRASPPPAGDATPLIRATESVLDLVGGALFDGYRVGGETFTPR